MEDKLYCHNLSDQINKLRQKVINLDRKVEESISEREFINNKLQYHDTKSELKWKETIYKNDCESYLSYK
jgi:hypothetical protein